MPCPSGFLLVHFRFTSGPLPFHYWFTSGSLLVYIWFTSGWLPVHFCFISLTILVDYPCFNGKNWFLKNNSLKFQKFHNFCSVLKWGISDYRATTRENTLKERKKPLLFFHVVQIRFVLKVQMSVPNCNLGKNVWVFDHKIRTILLSVVVSRIQFF